MELIISIIAITISIASFLLSFVKFNVEKKQHKNAKEKERIEKIYEPLWINVNSDVKELLEPKIKLIVCNNGPSYGTPYVDVQYLYDFADSVNYLTEKDLLKTHVNKLIKDIDMYIRSCKYAANEIKRRYKRIVIDAISDYENEAEVFESIEFHETLSGYYVLFKILNEYNFLSEYVDNYADWCHVLAKKEDDIWHNMRELIDKDYNFRENYISVQNGFLTLKSVLQDYIKDGDLLL